jgi:hypothetical protein
LGLIIKIIDTFGNVVDIMVEVTTSMSDAVKMAKRTEKVIRCCYLQLVQVLICLKTMKTGKSVQTSGTKFIIFKKVKSK